MSGAVVLRPSIDMPVHITQQFANRDLPIAIAAKIRAVIAFDLGIGSAGQSGAQVVSKHRAAQIGRCPGALAGAC